MNYFGVTKWDQVLKVFEKGGALEGNWGWLATLRNAEVGDTISFVSNSKNADGSLTSEELFTGTLASENGMYSLSSDVGSIPLSYAEKFPCNGYEVRGVRGGEPGPWGLRVRSVPFSHSFEATQQYPVIKYNPNNFDLVNAELDVTSIFASLVGGNTFTFGVKAARTANTAGRYASVISFMKSLSVNQNPNSIITSAGGFIPGPVGGAFSLAALFYDLGFYTAP